MKQVVLVGHCGADTYSLTEAVRAAAGEQVRIDRANNDRELEKAATPGSLLLINRQLDGRFQAGGGIDLIRLISAQDQPPSMMLISNYESSQQEAVQAGAEPGFGKSELRDPSTQQRIHDAVMGDQKDS